MKKYDSYKDSGIEWIGEIPSHWAVNKVKHNFSFKTGFTPPSGKSEYYEDGTHVWINISDLQEKEISDSVNKITDKAIEDFKPEIVQKGSLLYSFKLSVGRVGFNTMDCYTNEAIFSINPDSSTNLNFFYYSLPDQILKNANENIYGAKILNQELIKNAYLVIPPTTEQTSIASFLDLKTSEIDDIIADKKRLLELYEEEKTAIINQAVTKGLDPNAPMKDSGIEWLGEIPEYWEVKKLKMLVSKVGSGVTPRGGSSVYLSIGIPLIRSQNVHFDGLKLDDVAFISEEVDEEMSNSRIQDGDVLLNITGASIGRCYFVPDGFGRGNVNQHVCIIRPNINEVSTVYLSLLLRSEIGQLQIRLQQTGANREGLNFEQLKNFYLPVATSLNEQQSIVHHIESECSKIDFKKARTEELIELLTEYRTALVSEAVTGKIKVTED